MSEPRRKNHSLTILPLETAKRIADIAGPHSACAKVVRQIELIGDMADDFEICRTRGGVVGLVPKHHLWEDGGKP